MAQDTDAAERLEWVVCHAARVQQLHDAIDGVLDHKQQPSVDGVRELFHATESVASVAQKYFETMIAAARESKHRIRGESALLDGYWDTLHDHDHAVCCECAASEYAQQQHRSWVMGYARSCLKLVARLHKYAQPSPASVRARSSI